MEEGDSELGCGGGTEDVQVFQTLGGHLVPFDSRHRWKRLFLAEETSQTRDKKLVEPGNVELAIGIEKNG